MKVNLLFHFKPLKKFPGNNKATARVLSGKPGTEDVDIVRMINALKAHCCQYLTEGSRPNFFRAVRSVLEAHVEERLYVEGACTDISVYMDIRRRTIAMNPFFEVIKSEYLPAHAASNPTWEQLQTHVSTVAGLQNDLIGLEKDMNSGEILNAVLIGTRSREKEDNCSFSEELLATSVAHVREQHNQAVHSSLESFSQLCHKSSPHCVQDVARHILTICHTHLLWCTSHRRYKMESVQTINPAPDAGQLIRSDGIFMGLPLYRPTPQSQRQTAIITGATGISGYNMVKVLAASERWAKVYCLSRRAPPERFFTDLGADADKVKHLSIDFLNEPDEITKSLNSTISRVYALRFNINPDIYVY